MNKKLLQRILNISDNDYLIQFECNKKENTYEITVFNDNFIYHETFPFEDNFLKGTYKFDDFKKALKSLKVADELKATNNCISINDTKYAISPINYSHSCTFSVLKANEKVIVDDSLNSAFKVLSDNTLKLEKFKELEMVHIKQTATDCILETTNGYSVFQLSLPHSIVPQNVDYYINAKDFKNSIIPSETDILYVQIENTKTFGLVFVNKEYFIFYRLQEGTDFFYSKLDTKMGKSGDIEFSEKTLKSMKTELKSYRKKQKDDIGKVEETDYMMLHIMNNQCFLQNTPVSFTDFICVNDFDINLYDLIDFLTVSLNKSISLSENTEVVSLSNGTFRILVSQ